MATTGFLQVDVDGLWAVRSCYGSPERDTFRDDPCWSEGIPAMADLFAGKGVPAGFFIVGRDLELDAKRRATRKLLHRGFELGNHSYTHRLGLTMEPTGFIASEIERTDHALRLLGADPRGFRSPGYDIDARVLRTVKRLGYQYDASLLPTYLAPVLRLADTWLARKLPTGKRQFGRFVYGRALRTPYFPRPFAIRKPLLRPIPENAILEIPVGTTPRLKLPLTASALFHLSRSRLRDLFRRLAETRRPTLLLLHAIDAVDCRRPIVFDSRRPGIAGFSMSGADKLRRMTRVVEEFSSAFSVTRADKFAASFITRSMA